MCNDHVIPCVAILVTEDNKMVRHRIARIWCFQPIAQLERFSQRGLGEMDMINVSPFPGSGDRCRRFTCGGFRRALAVNERGRKQAKQCDGNNNGDRFRDDDVLFWFRLNATWFEIHVSTSANRA
jgi:hypothetical protein